MSTSLRITFEGTILPRNTFLKKIRDKIHAFVGDQIGFIMFLHEIIKNVYDHTQGLGYLSLVFISPTQISFEVKDTCTEKFDLEEIKRSPSSKAGNGINFGNGLTHGMIESMATTLGITLHIDCSCGFTYSGIYTVISS